ncbi:MAG: hypothetical protein IT445_14035 [Phycisphaeraceae bacterium]|nr:hypothetical protein [Phycisphaeraceae bacterium]
MQRWTPYILWLLTGAAIGIVSSTLLFALWAQLDCRQPMAHWLDARGFPLLAGYWGMVWLHLPDWAIVAVVGLCGGMLIKRRPIIRLLTFGASFVLAPLVLSAATGSLILTFGWALWLQTMMWNSLSVMILILFALAGIQLRSIHMQTT